MATIRSSSDHVDRKDDVGALTIENYEIFMAAF
jgi:hypothetical protein